MPELEAESAETAKTPEPTAPPARPRRVAATVVKVLAALGGLALLAYMIHTAGPARLWQHLRTMGWWFGGVLAISATWFFLNSWGWRFTFRPRTVRFWRLLQVHLISEAVNNITPFLSLGGEPLKILLLKQDAGAGVVLASVVNDNVVHVITAVVFMLLGLACGVFLFDLDRQLALGLLGAILLLGLGTMLLVLRARRGLLAPLVRLGLRWKLRPLRTRGASLLERAVQVDGRIGEFLGERRQDFAGCFAGHLLGRLMGAVETWFILWVLGTPVSLATSIFILAIMHVLVNLIFSIVPSQLGVQEGVAWLLFRAIGLEPTAAVALALIRRIRGFCWIGVGLVLLAVSRRDESAAGSR